MSRLRVFLGIICTLIIAGIVWQGVVHYKDYAAKAKEPAVEKEEGATPAQEPAKKTDGDAKEDQQPKEGEEAQKPDGEQAKAAESDDEKSDAETQEEEQPLEAVNLNNVEMKKIIQTISEWTDKPVIPFDDKLLGQKITIYATKEVPRDQALSLIYSAIRAKGYIAEETNGAIYLKPVSKAKLGGIPTVGVDEPLARIADRSQIVEKFFKIDNYSPSRLQEIITPITAEYGHVTADDNTKTLAVIDTVENLMRVQRIIDQLDTEENEQYLTKIFELKAGDPAEVVQLLQMLMGNNSSSRGRSRKGGQPPRPAGPNQASATSVVLSSSKNPLVLIPEPRRKWIIAKGSADDINEVQKWIDKLDSQESISTEQSVVQIRFVDVREVANAVNRTIANMPGTKLKANVVVQALPQARQIVIFGSEENRRLVEKLIAEIDLPSSGMFDEKTFELKYADPDQIKENIDQLYGEQNDSNRWYWRRSNNKSSDTVKVISYSTLCKVTVIASAENLEKISKQIQEWDIPIDKDKQQYKVLTLHNSDPKQMAELLTDLFTEKSNQRQTPWWYWGGGNDSKKKKIVGSLYGKLSFEAVPDTKKIIVISKIPEAYEIIEELVGRLDSQEKAEVPRVMILKYADAEDLCDQMNAIFNESGTTATVRRSQRGLSEYDATGDGDGKSKTTQQKQTVDTIKPWWNSGVARGRNQTASPTSNLIGKIRFIPVQRSKAVLVLAPPEYMDEIQDMIEKLDEPGKQVMVKAVIVSVDHSSMTSLGVQLANDVSAFGNIGENALTSLTKLTLAQERGMFSFSTDSNISALLDLLIKHANAKILNQPTLWTKDNEESTFFKGQNIAFRVSQNTSTEGTATRDQFEYNRVGITLRVRPNITPEKAVDTTINLSISQVEPDNVNGNIATSELDTTTHVIVKDGETIMLGGILFQQDSEIERKLPLLGDAPLVGGLFNHTDKVIANSELLVFVTPYVVEDQNGFGHDRVPFKKELDTLKKVKCELNESTQRILQKDCPDKGKECIKNCK